MKFTYLQKVRVLYHPSLHSFYGENAIYDVWNFRPIVGGERFYLIRPVNGTNRYRVVESNLSLVE